MNRSLATALVLQKAVLDQLRLADAETRAAAREELVPGDAVSVTVAGETAGRVRVDKPRVSWKVTDRDALVAWLAEHHPGMLVTRPRIVDLEAATQWLATWRPGMVRLEYSLEPASEKALLAAGEITDETTGEILTPPGLVREESEPRLVVSTTDAAKSYAAELLRTTTAQIEES